MGQPHQVEYQSRLTDGLAHMYAQALGAMDTTNCRHKGAHQEQPVTMMGMARRSQPASTGHSGQRRAQAAAATSARSRSIRQQRRAAMTAGVSSSV